MGKINTSDRYSNQYLNRYPSTTNPTMEKDVVETIETTAPTKNEQNKDLYVAVELDTGGGGNPDKGPVIIRF